MRFSSLFFLLCFSAWGGEATGKVYVQSVPPGAEILVSDGEELKSTGKKTPGLVELSVGPATLVIRKDGFADASVWVVAGSAITKTDVVTLQLPQVEVDVLSAEPGWRLFRDGQPLKDKTGKTAVTPCTVLLPVGRATLGLAKEGFADITERVTVDEKTEMFEVKAKPTKGRSALLWAELKSFCGKWKLTTPGGWSTVWTLNPDFTFVATKRNEGAGTWRVVDGKLIATFEDGSIREHLPVGENCFRTADGERQLAR